MSIRRSKRKQEPHTVCPKHPPRLSFGSAGALLVCLCCLVFGVFEGCFKIGESHEIQDRWELSGHRSTHVHVAERNDSSALELADGTRVEGVTRRVSYVVQDGNCTRRADDGTSSWTLPNSWKGRTVFELDPLSPFFDTLYGFPLGAREAKEILSSGDPPADRYELEDFMDYAKDLHSKVGGVVPLAPTLHFRFV